jgi:N-acetylglucosamine kinase-like BadF-type ATPase
MTETRGLVLAVDGGQTSSKAIVATTGGHILGRGSGSACDHLHGAQGYERNRAAIHSSAHAALAAANRDASEIEYVGLGLTSAPRESEFLPLFHQMVREMCTPRSIWVDADFVSNLAGASGGSPGVVVIAGGGSIGYGVDATGREAIAGGLGYLMGDEGSGWYFGLRALQEAARASDRRGPETALLPMILEHYGITGVRQIIRVIYDRDFLREQVSCLAPQVMAIAQSGDVVASNIVHTGAGKLADLALGVIRQLHEPNFPVRVYPTGGIFTAGPVITAPFTEAIQTAWPTAHVATPRFPPVVGAYLQALIHVGLPVTDTVRNQIASSLGNP